MLKETNKLESHCSTAKDAKLWMDSICGPHDLDVYGHSDLNFHHKGNRFPELGIVTGFLSYGCDVAININPENNLKGYSISLPVAGHQTLRHDGLELYSDENQGLIVSPASQQELNISSNCQKFQLLIPSKSVAYVAEKIIGKTIQQPIQFDAKMELIRPEMKAWWCIVQQTAKHWQTMQALYTQPQMMKDLEFSLIKGLLLSQPNNISKQFRDSLSAPSNDSIPAYLIHACEWMKKNASERIYIEEIAKHTGVSKFILFAGFRDYFNDTPLGWLKKYRMNKVRLALFDSNNREKISNIAMEWGFTHFGRFSQQYQEYFNELPSETINNARKNK
ncbi:AraC family transcriptional regulator [Marinomonas foliarum]|uniref:AraC-like DNA-binding protein n=1 Tax=Marinomonas foliarum TaxID=491950 RepID=A0A369A9P2_9GAMM|nr:AraC family transcriptional regulator [Marinomonas foliarum]RCX05863.1 AraC-like DNA-binding protein [Marinomonas foliarum]